ncbi:MAG TPA: transglycosylase SLT domain-containing protein [Chitinophagaceae bacterium]|nr:transglycosylase SLT domain-containing protein [Chitinophagaceae bacterium]
MKGLILIILGVFAFGAGRAGTSFLEGPDGASFQDTTGQVARTVSGPSEVNDTLIDVPDETLQADPGTGLPGDLSDWSIANDNLNSRAIDFISYFYKLNSRSLETFQSRGATYLSEISDIFHKYGIPDEMKYLAVIESGLNINAVSRMGAVGTWQFMASTARLMGLDVTRHRDDRRNFYKSTDAAAKYLSQMHGQLQNWLLVVAAYDCGLGGVEKAINASGTTNFWQLEQYLPAESRKHVLKFIATAYILDRFTSFFGLHDQPPALPQISSPSFTDEPLKALTVSGRLSLPVIAGKLGIDSTELATLNPDFATMSSQRGNYTLNLPSAKVDLFRSGEASLKAASVLYMIKHPTPEETLAEAKEFPAHHKRHSPGHKAWKPRATVASHLASHPDS